MNITGNTILITGGTSGIGLAFAEEFLTAGNTVIVCGRRTERLGEIQETHPGIVVKQCDITNEQERDELADWAIKNYPSLNVVMNNAGIQLGADLNQPVNVAKVRNEIETNLVAPIHLSSLFAPHLKMQQAPVIINITSGLAFVPIAFMPVYCATKAAMHSYTLSLRHQLKDSITVIEVAPPSTDTELGHERREDKTQSHGGIPVSEFLAEAMEGLKSDNLEIAVGMAKGMRAKREELFSVINH